MADMEKLTKSLQKNGFQVTRFATAAQAADYLDGQIDGKTVGFGGSITLRQMGMEERLGSHNTVLWHWNGTPAQEVTGTQVYLSSVNGAAETGELVNIDGVANRVASGLFGHEKVYFIIGANKVAPDFDAALWRARNIAAPKNAQRLNCPTPCAVKGDKCYDCSSPQRICNALVVYWRKPGSMDFEVVLVDEELGY